MSAVSKIYNTDGSSKIFSSDFKILSESHVAVYLNALEVSKSSYDVINNSIVFETAPVAGKVLEVKVGTTPDDVVTPTTDIVKVANIDDDITTVAGVSDDVTTVASRITHVSDVARNIDAVVNAARVDADDVATIANMATALSTVADGISAINTTSSNMTHVSRVSTNMTSVTTASNNVDDIITTANSISDVSTVAGDITNINSVATEVAPNVTAILAVETNASASATAAATSATAAATSETNASASATAAATSETNAATSATSSATSASNAATSATASSTSATASATSATASANSASAAATSETNAATSETNAAASAAAAAQSAIDAAIFDPSSYTKTFTANEEYDITLNKDVTAPSVAVYKEVPQANMTNNTWDVTGSNYEFEDFALDTTLTPSAIGSGKFTLGAGSFTADNVGMRIVGNGGEAILTATDGSYKVITEFTDTSTIASGSWNMYGLEMSADGVELSGEYELKNTHTIKSLENVSSGNELSVNIEYFSFTDWGGTFGESVLYASGSYLYSVIVGTPLDLSSNLTPLESLYVGNRESSVLDVKVYNNNEHIFFIGSGSDKLYRYDSTIPGVLSYYYTAQTLSVAGYETAPNSFVFVDDGKKLFITGTSGDGIESFNLSTPYAFNAITYNNDYVAYSSVHSDAGGSPRLVHMDNEGTYCIVYNAYKLFQFGMTVPYDTSTLYPIKVVSIPDGIYRGFAFDSIGNLLITKYGTPYTYDKYSTGAFLGKKVAPSNQYIPAISPQINTQYWSDINSMTATETLNNQTVNYAVSTDNRMTWSVAKPGEGVRNIVRNNNGTWEYNSNDTYASTTWTPATANNEFQALSEAVGSGSVVVFNEGKLDGDFLAKIQASDAQSYDNFGYSVAVSDTRIVIGAYREDTTASAAGSVYIYDIDGNFIAKIQASDAEADDNFGYSVAVSDNRIVVGAPFEDTTVDRAGSVYIYDIDGVFLYKIQASETQAIALFGWSVAVSDSLIVVGAPYEDGATSNSGSAYIYDIYGTFIAKIQDSEPNSNAQFGYSVAVSDNRIVVGAPYEYTTTGSAGSVYIYDIDGIFITKIQDSAPSSNDNFGYSVAVNDSIIVVGAPYEDTGATDAGSVYIYDIDGGFLQTIQASDRQASDYFGWSVAVSDSLIVVGAPYEDTIGTNAGSAYIYDVYGNFLKKIQASDAQVADLFGKSVAVSNARIIVGADEEDTTASNAGSVYMYYTEEYSGFDLHTFTSVNQMSATQLQALQDTEQIELGDTLDLAMILHTDNSTETPIADGVSINYDGYSKYQQATVNTDYEVAQFDSPTGVDGTNVRIKSLADNNLKIRIV